jgi:stage II sporulation protein D
VRRIRTVSLLLVTAITAACRPGEIPRNAPPAGPAARATPSGRSPTVRVGVAVDSGSVTVGGTAGVTLIGPDGATLAETGASERWLVERDGDGGGLRMVNGFSALTSPGPVVARPRGDGAVTVDRNVYRGEMLLRADSGGVTAVNVVDLEAYLLGVVAREIGRRPLDELEAVKAQAVAARTYAIGNLGGRESLGFDFFGSDRDQVYGGLEAEDPVATRAVQETRGEIVTYDGVPILAYYSSTCGGHTAAIEEAWPWRAPLPYLRSVSDEIPGTGRYYCETSNRFQWSVRWTRAELLSALGRTLAAYTAGRVTSVRNVDDVAITSSGPSGRKTVRLGVDGAVYLLRADSVRWVLRTPAGAGLNSSRIDDLATTRDADGVSSLSIDGGGWGHGIGMCQVGAMGRARAGQSYQEILQAYYTDTRIRRMY